jgi:hypothetical protein
VTLRSRKRNRATGPTADARLMVMQRALSQCEKCGMPLSGDFSIHHRKPRGMGGTRDKDINNHSNLLLLCGSGTTGCHGWVESHRLNSYERGLLLHRAEHPAETPYQDDRGSWWTLSADGTRTRITYPR